MANQDPNTGHPLQELLRPGGASPSDILTTIKNLVTAINAATEAYLNVNGITTLEDISTETVVKPAAGRLATVSITTAGSAVGYIYDSTVVTASARKLFTIPNTIGIVHVNLPADYGIVAAPGTGQVVTVAFS